MANQWMQARQTKYAAYAVSLHPDRDCGRGRWHNVLANRYNKSYDTTANKRYSLSDQTAKIVKGLKQDANHHLLQPEHTVSRRQGSARPVREPFPEAACEVRGS